MEVYDTLNGLPRGAVIAIGNFDGVHRGHAALIASGRKMADAKGCAFSVLTFEPHPRKLFRPDDPPFRLTPPELKYKRLSELGVDFTVALPFDWDFASQSAEDFVENVLIRALAPAAVMIGPDFRFGQLRKGNAETIEQAGLEVTRFPMATNEAGETFSSTAIREALRHGDIDRANTLLGWDWELGGEIVRGDRRGHELGYPTANVPIMDVLHPAYGIYAAFVQIEGEDEWRPSATNIGIRPMFELKQGQIEAHILDFADRDIYGKYLRVRPVKRLRGEAKFASLDDLKIQMEKDCAAARSILS